MRYTIVICVFMGSDLMTFGAHKRRENKKPETKISNLVHSLLLLDVIRVNIDDLTFYQHPAIWLSLFMHIENLSLDVVAVPQQSVL